MANTYNVTQKLQTIADAISDSGGVVPSLNDVAQDLTLQATNTALGSLATDTTLQATNTALGSLASDSSLQTIADDLETGSDLITALGSIATAISQGGGGGGTSNYNDLSNKPSINSVTLSGNKTSTELSLAGTSDISSIIATGSTNTTGSAISSGTYFYLNGVLCRAISNIATGATFTLNTNYLPISVGEALTSLNSNLLKLDDYVMGTNVDIKGYNSSSNKYTAPHFGIVSLRVASGQQAYVSGITGFDAWVFGGGNGNTASFTVCKGTQFYFGGTVAVANYTPFVEPT